MNEFMSNLTKGSFWLGVVVVGLLINFASSWLQSLFAKYSTRYFQRRKDRAEKEDRAYTRMLEQAKESDRHFDLLLYRGHYLGAAADRFLMLATGLLVLFLILGLAFTIVDRQPELHSSTLIQWVEIASYGIVAACFFACMGLSSRYLTKSIRCADLAYEAARK